jgi:hypothetical protein
MPRFGGSAMSKVRQSSWGMGAQTSFPLPMGDGASAMIFAWRGFNTIKELKRTIAEQNGDVKTKLCTND